MMAQNDNTNGRRRFSLRTRRFKKARIVTCESGNGIEAIIRDTSRSGAQLEIVSKQPLSQNFIMHIDSEDRFHHCQLRWRRNGKLGVEILA